MSNEVITESIDKVWDYICLKGDGSFLRYAESTTFGSWSVIEAASNKMMLKSESLKLFLKLFSPNTDVYSSLAYSCLVEFSELEGLKTPVLRPVLHHRNSLVFPLVEDIKQADVFKLFSSDDLNLLKFKALQYHMWLAFSTEPSLGGNLVETGRMENQQKVIDPLNDLPSRLKFFINL